MGDRENTDPDNQQGQNNPPAPLPPVPAPPAPNPNQPHGEDVHQPANGNEEPPEHRFNNPDWWMVILTGLTLIVGIATLRIFYRQFQEMQTQTKQAASDSAESANKVERQLALAKQQNDIAIAANRPWVGTVPNPTEQTLNIQRVKDDRGSGTMIQFMYLWNIKNAGHRPARMESVHTTGMAYSRSCGTHPDYDKIGPGVITMPFSPKRTSKALLVPDTTVKSLFVWPFSEADWKDITDGKKVWCTYLSIEYRDVNYSDALHHLRECRIYERITNTMLLCDNEYYEAD